MMNSKERRAIAIGAARSYLRKNGNDPDKSNYDSGLAALDDLSRLNKRTVAAVWYIANWNNDSQLRLFRKEWNRRAKGFTI